MYNLAGEYAILERYADALKLSEESYRGMLGVLGPQHWQTLRSLNNVIASLIALDRQAEAIPRIDEFLAQVQGVANPRWPGNVCDLRLRYFEKRGDAAGCRATAVIWERLEYTDLGSLYEAACLRAVTAQVIRLTDGSPDAARAATVEADLAMRWLHKAVAAGYKDAKHLKADDDLSALRNRSDFRLLVAKLEGRTVEVAPPPRPAR